MAGPAIFLLQKPPSPSLLSPLSPLTYSPLLWTHHPWSLSSPPKYRYSIDHIVLISTLSIDLQLRHFSFSW